LRVFCGLSGRIEWFEWFEWFESAILNLFALVRNKKLNFETCTSRDPEMLSVNQIWRSAWSSIGGQVRGQVSRMNEV
jgi:hypothetical protein